MNKLKTSFLLIIFLTVTYFPYSESLASTNQLFQLEEKQANSVVSIEQEQQNYDSTYKSNIHKAPSQIPTHYEVEYSIGLKIALELEYLIYEQFDIESIQSANIHDLAIVHFTIAYIDLFFTTLDPYYLDQAHFLNNQSLKLLMNGQLIAEYIDGASNYTVYAYDNLYLALMYQRMAKAYDAYGDPLQAEYYWGRVNVTMALITSYFYSSQNSIIREYIQVDINDYSVIYSHPYTTAEVAGLYGLVAHGMKDRSEYHTQSYNVIYNYYTGNITGIDLGEGFTRWVVIKGTSSTNNGMVDLTGNIYLAAALMQESVYQQMIGNTTESENYFINGLWLLEDITAVLYNPTYNLFVNSYDITTNSSSPIIFTSDCALLTMIIREFNRLHVQRYGFSLGEISSGIIQTINDLFRSGNFYDVGLSTQQGVLSYKLEEYRKNPIVVNALALSMQTKYYPFMAIIEVPDRFSTNITLSLRWELLWRESSNIFSFSNATFEVLFDFSINSYLNFTANDTLTIKTHMIDGRLISSQTVFYTNATTSEGGEYQPIFIISIGDENILWYTPFFYVEKELRVYTDPTTIQATQGIDDYIEFSIICEDESGALVPQVNLILMLEENTTTVKTGSGGSYEMSIPLNAILNLPQFQENPDENPRVELYIYAYKEGYTEAWISKVITIRRNALNLLLSQDLSVKKGNDLTLTIAVQPQIQTVVMNPRAEIFLNDKEVIFTIIQDPKNMPKFIPINLPAQVTLPTSDLKEDGILRIVITSSNFPKQEFEYTIVVIPLNTYEAIYQWTADALSSTWVKVLGSLSVIWAILWKQFRLYILRTLKRCPYCGETGKSKYSVCRYCGNVINPEKYDSTKIKQTK
ncbi:MAG: hypothetical protein ACTSQE_05650 [Candidatus Heimdallarchaeaceae archaeon]